LFVYVKVIEPEQDDFLRFSFRIRRSPERGYQGPDYVGAKPGGRRAPHGTLFEYVFTTQNTLEQNRRNLEDFVRRQCGAKEDVAR
jgi:hypothetical protein